MKEESSAEILKEIWSYVLGNKIDITKNFFENGGDSYRATLVAAEIQKRLNIRIELGDLYYDSSFERVMDYINNGEMVKTDFASNVSQQHPSSINETGMFILDKQFKNIGYTYHIPILAEIKGLLDVNRLQESLNTVFRSCDILRSNYRLQGDKVYSIISETDTLPLIIKYMDYDGFINTISDQIIPFCLEEDVLIRTTLLIDSGSEKTYLFIDQHHIITDGTSVNQLLRYIAEAYNGSIGADLPSYQIFAKKQLSQIQSDEIKECKEYWFNYLHNVQKNWEFPMDGVRKDTRTFHGTRRKYHFNKSLYNELENLSIRYGTTAHSIMFAAFALLLYHYTKSEEFCVGTITSGRESLESQNALGLFINTLPLKFSFGKDLNFNHLLERLKNDMKFAYRYQKYPYLMITEDLGLSGSRHKTPLFDVVFMFQNMDNKRIAIEKDLFLEPYEYFGQGSRYDWMLEVNIYEEDEPKLIIEYNLDLYSENRMLHIVEAYLSILKAIISNPERNIMDFDILTESDKRIIFGNHKEAWNNDYVYEPLPAMFRRNMPEKKDTAAVITSEKELSYYDLDRYSNRVSEYLIAQYAKSDVIAILMYRTEDIIISYLSVIKSGCVFLPIDPNIPLSKIHYMLKMTNAKLILINKDMSDNYGIPTIKIDQLYTAQLNCDARLAFRKTDNSDLAYILFTSGSTGNSKGVMVEQGSLHNFFAGMDKAIRFQEINTVLGLTTISFDISILELLLPIFYGKTVFLANEKEQRSDRQLKAIVDNYPIDLFQLTPSRLKLFLNSGHNIFKGAKKILIGGEMVALEDIHQLKLRTKAEIYNVYGPTETTIWSAVKSLDGKASITAGKGILNTDIFIMDAQNCLVPVGVKGFLSIGGLGLSRGYVNNKIETEKKFKHHKIPITFADKRSWLETRLYHTGDLAMLDYAGELVILGRADNEIKLNGHRIDIDDVQNCIMKCSGVVNAAVLCNVDETGIKYLSCYYTGTELDTRFFHQELIKYLPQYLIPAAYTFLKEMPLNLSGKVDVNRLKSIRVQTKKMIENEAISELEKQIREIWMLVLETEQIDIYDDFYEHGGNSLRAMRMLAEFEKRGISERDFDLTQVNSIHKLSIIISKEKEEHEKSTNR